MMWKPPKTLGVVAGLIVVSTIVGIDAFLIRTMVGQDIGLDLFFTALVVVLTFPLLFLWCRWYYGLLTLRYYLDRNGLVISTGTCRHTVPLGSIERVVPGTQVSTSRGFRGVSWPGYMVGHMHLREHGLLRTYSTEPLERQLVVITDAVCYGISPKNVERFLADYAVRRSLGPMRKLQQETETCSLAGLPIWRDRWFWGVLILGFAANAVLLGLLSSLYGKLPDSIPIHFNAQGEVDRISSKAGLFVIPGIGTLTLLVNGLLGMLLHQDERLGAYLLVLMTLIAHAVLWLAAAHTLAR